MSHDVFISCAPEDAQTALPLCSVLEENGISCWCAVKDLPQDADQASEAEKAIDACRILVLLCTDSSIDSPQVLSEVGSAISAGKTVIPFILTRNRPGGAMEYYIATLHWQNGTGIPLDTAIDQLLDRIRDVLSEEPQKRAKKKTRKKIRFTFQKIRWGRLLMSLFSLTAGAFLIGTGLTRGSYKNDAFFMLIGVGIAFLVLGVFQAARAVGRPLARRHRLVCLASFLSVIVLTWGLCKYYYRFLPEDITFDSADQDTCMNSANHAVIAAGADGTVYYCDSADGVRGIYRISLEDFLAGKDGEEVVRGVTADSLTILSDGRLVFRDCGKERYRMKVFDPSTGRIRTYRLRPSSYYYACGDVIFFTEECRYSHGFAYISADGRYEGTKRMDSYYPFFYDDNVFYVFKSHLSEQERFSGISPDVRGIFIICDGMIYYQGVSGGLYRAPLEDPDDIVKLSSGTPSGLVVCGGWIYFLNYDDGDSLYRVPADGGEAEKYDDRTFRTLNVIRDNLYLETSDGQFLQLQNSALESSNDAA